MVTNRTEAAPTPAVCDQTADLSARIGVRASPGQVVGSRVVGDAGGGAAQGDDVALDQLAPAAGLDLAVHADPALDDHRAGLGAGLHQVGELEELTQPDRVVADGDVERFGHGAIVLGRDARGARGARGARDARGARYPPDTTA